MPSAINSDNGVVSGSAGLKSSADSSGVLDLQTNGTTAISISASQVVTYTNQPTYTGGTANGVMYLNGSKAVTTGTALTFDGSQLDIPLGSAGTPSLSTPTDPNTGMFFPAADTIAFAEGGVEAMRLDASGNLNMTGGGTANTANTFGFKNRIINGGMVIDQRNAGASVAFSSGVAYAADRFQAYNQATGAYTIQQVSDAPAGFKYSDKITTTTAGSTGTAGWTSFVQHKIEGFNIADLGAGTASAQSITLSFWVKSSLTGAMPALFANDVDRVYATTYTINSANTWEQKTITLTLSTGGTWNSTNGRGLLITWGLGSGSTYTTATLNSWQNTDGIYFTSGAVAVGATLNATWQITGVQLEKGTQATSFDFRPYGTELALCQRYYENGPATVTTWLQSGTAGKFFATYQVAKRTSASISTVSGGTYLAQYPGNTYASGNNSSTGTPTFSIASGASSAYGFATDFTIPTSFPSTGYVLMWNNFSVPYWAASAEL